MSEHANEQESTRLFCVECRCEYNAAHTTRIGGDIVCLDCVVDCDCCGGANPASNIVHVHTSESQWDNAPYCTHCADYTAWRCSDCGAQFAESVHAYTTDDYDSHLCRSCYRDAEREAEQERANIIGSYHNPARRAATYAIESEWTRRHAGRFLGVELEVERHESSGEALHDIARVLLDAANDAGRRLFAEHDGSLCDGFELITQPLGLDDQRALWSRVLALPTVRELRAHDTTTCGLHVHVTRAGLSRLQIAKAVVFLNDARNEDFIRAIARRYGNGYCKLKRVALGQAASSYDRYEMLNLTSSRTVEFRLFRGTLRATTLLACVEFAHALLEWCKVASCGALTWQSFVTWCHAPEQRADTLNLRAYLTRRVTERMAPRYVALRDVITACTGKTPARLTPDTSATRWAEI